MTMTHLEVLSIGVTLFEDTGRFGYETVGVPGSGVFDPRAYRALQGLLNLDHNPVVEHLAGTLEVRLPQSAPGGVTYAVIGGSHIHQGGSRVSAGTVMVLAPGDTLIVEAQSGAPAWVAFSGLTTSKVLGSSAYDTFSRLGPAPIQVGDQLAVTTDQAGTLVGRFMAPKPFALFQSSLVIRYVPGPHQEIDLCTNTWEVSSVTRSGIRLQKPHDVPLSWANTPVAVLPSLPTLPGVIQMPPSGNPVVLGPDAGVTGGYHIAGVVITADLGKLAWLPEGGHVAFQPVTGETAGAVNDSLTEALNTKVLDPRGIC